MDDLLYLQRQDKQLEEYESRCRRCGECCGSNGDDPCANLTRDKNDNYNCVAYANRLGSQRTVSGKEFNCVLIRDIVKFDLPYSKCPYVK